MGFNTLTDGTLSFEQRQSGVYMLSTVTLGDPLVFIQFRPVQVSNGTYRVSLSAVQEKEITSLSGAVSNTRQTWSLSGVIPVDGFTVSECRALVSRLNTIYSSTIMSRHLLGEI